MAVKWDLVLLAVSLTSMIHLLQTIMLMVELMSSQLSTFHRVRVVSYQVTLSIITSKLQILCSLEMELALLLLRTEETFCATT